MSAVLSGGCVYSSCVLSTIIPLLAVEGMRVSKVACACVGSLAGRTRAVCWCALDRAVNLYDTIRYA